MQSELGVCELASIEDVYLPLSILEFFVTKEVEKEGVLSLSFSFLLPFDLLPCLCRRVCCVSIFFRSLFLSSFFYSGAPLKKGKKSGEEEEEKIEERDQV